ncbi:MAG: GlsB/YeaQ/YmgE family stress response membrane protein [Thermoleophilaceae bacterium]|nr:GlsB/YeaQ/YmgE family stress response membrane protein [Thermoleophilaceae bacterium]
MGIVTWAVWGLFVGIFARILKPGGQRVGIVLTVVLGVVGSLIGGFVATELLGIADADEFDFGSFIIAVAASVLLLAVWNRVDRMLPDRDRKQLPR